MRFSCLLIIAGSLLAVDACVPFGGGGASCGAPPCAPPAPSCGFPGGCSPPAVIAAAPPVPPGPPPVPSCGGGGGGGCAAPQVPPVPQLPQFPQFPQVPQVPQAPPAPTNCGLGGCTQPAGPIVVNCGSSGCSPPVAPAALSCGPTGCASSSSSNINTGSDSDVHYEDYEGGETGDDSSSVTSTPAAYTEAPAGEEEAEKEGTDAEYEEVTELPPGGDVTEAPTEPEAPAEEETVAPAATEAPAEETEAPAYTDDPAAAKATEAPAAGAEEGEDNAPCQFLTCNFEQGTLCLYQNKEVERKVSVAARARRLTGRNAEHPKPWVPWMGKFGNRVTGIIEAPADPGSTFAAAYLKPGETAVLESDILYFEGQTIKFDAYEATEDVALRMCCDSLKDCKWETSTEAYAASRSWRQVESTCPSGTKKVLFVCQNTGQYQGACGLDNIKVAGSQCAQVKGKKTQSLQPFALFSS